MKKHIFKTIFIGCSVLCGTMLSAQGEPAVMVSEVIQIDETGARQYIGRLDAIKDATIPARVSGELMKCNFKEGDSVEAGTVLFELDDTIYQANRESAEAQVKQAKAQITQADALIVQAEAQITQAKAQITQANAQIEQANAQMQQANANKKYADGEFQRADDLRNVESQRNLDVATRDKALADAQIAAAKAQIAAANAAKATAEGNLKAAEASKATAVASKEAANATLASAKAALKNAETNLSYTKIKAPFSGKIGKATFSVGNYVTPSSGSLAQLTQINPVYVRFAISEPDYLKFVTEAFAKETDKSVKKNATELLKDYLSVYIVLSDRSPYDQPATITILDNKIDRSTGTLMVWATIDNSNYKLTPGAIVTVQVTKKVPEKKSAVPISAIQISQQGQFVWVLNPASNEVMPMPVKPGEIIGAHQIVSGLMPGQHVVVNGMHKIIPTPGKPSKVKPVYAPAAK